MKDDIDIVRILRDQRWLIAGMKALLKNESPELKRSVRKDSQMMLIDPLELRKSLSCGSDTPVESSRRLTETFS